MRYAKLSSLFLLTCVISNSCPRWKLVNMVVSCEAILIILAEILVLAKFQFFVACFKMSK